MAKLIQTRDGILIEVETDEDEKCSARAAKKVEKGLDQIGPVLTKACEAMNLFWKQQVEGVDLDEVQIEFGLNFEAEGSAYIARAKAGANISITATLKKPA